MVTRVLLDTDIGSDVDDLVALALILCSPELRLAITKEHATSTASNVRASSVSTRTAWWMAWSIITRKRVVAGIADPGRRSHRLRLQLRNRFANILHRHICRDARSADLRDHHKTDFAAFELLIELQRFEDFFARDIFQLR